MWFGIERSAATVSVRGSPAREVDKRVNVELANRVDSHIHGNHDRRHMSFSELMRLTRNGCSGFTNRRRTAHSISGALQTMGVMKNA